MSIYFIHCHKQFAKESVSEDQWYCGLIFVFLKTVKF